MRTKNRLHRRCLTTSDKSPLAPLGERVRERGRSLPVLLLLLLTSCTLDPRQVLAQAALHVQLQSIPPGGATAVITALDSSGKEVVKRAPLNAQSALEIIFERGTLTDGALTVGAVVLSSDNTQLACGAALGEGTGSTIVLTLTRANDDANCGACGRACEGAPNATRTCVASTATCGPLTCLTGWFNVNGDASDGCETTCASPMPENSTTTCRNGLDDDCDGKKDCLDENCAGFTRACTISTCAGTETWNCATDSWGTCTAPAGLESDVTACSNGLDDDCDSKLDCADETCNGLTRACMFMSCAGTQTWACASQTWGTCMANTALENSVAACTDGVDNDCDGKTDCMDPSCDGLRQACTLSTCSGEQEWTCSTNTWSTCAVDPRLEASPATCSDGQDNDCDGKKDCQDPECLNIKQGCGLNLCAAGVKTWLCSAQLYSLCVPYISLPESSDLLCGDGLDNDCDQKTDCTDPDCTGKKCGLLGKTCCADGSCQAICP